MEDAELVASFMTLAMQSNWEPDVFILSLSLAGAPDLSRLATVEQVRQEHLEFQARIRSAYENPPHELFEVWYQWVLGAYERRAQELSAPDG